MEHSMLSENDKENLKHTNGSNGSMPPRMDSKITEGGWEG